MFLDLHEGVLEAFATLSRGHRAYQREGLHVAYRPAAFPDVTEVDFPRLEREARLVFRPVIALTPTEKVRTRRPQRVGDVSRGVARRVDPDYRARERVRQALAVKVKRAADPSRRDREAKAARDRRRMAKVAASSRT